MVLHEDLLSRNIVAQRDVRALKRMVSLILSFALAFVALISAKALTEESIKCNKP